MTTEIKNFVLVSVKGSEDFSGTLAEAKRAARKMQAEMQAAFGVDVENEDRVVVYTAR